MYQFASAKMAKHDCDRGWRKMITKEEFEAYESVRESGVTNMFALTTVMELSGLSKEKILDIMKDYVNLSKKHLGE